MHNADIVEIIWQRVSNAELIQYLTALKVQFYHQPRNYREVIQDISSQVPSIGVDTFRKASGVSVQGTESGGAPYQGVYDSNGLLFHGTYPEKKWFSDSVKPHWEDICELAMHLITTAISLRPDTGVVPIENIGTKISVSHP